MVVGFMKVCENYFAASLVDKNPIKLHSPAIDLNVVLEKKSRMKFFIDCKQWIFELILFYYYTGFIPFSKKYRGLI